MINFQRGTGLEDHGRQLPDGEAGEIGEPVEGIAGAGGDEGLGDLLQ